MAKMWRPQVTVDGKSSRARDYKEVKRAIRSLLLESDNNEVRVCRCRRGEWGEWFEYWSMVDGKPKITKQGWM